MDITTIYQVTITPIAAGAETFSGLFVQLPSVDEIRVAIGHTPRLVMDVDILNTILDSVTGLPEVSPDAHEDTAAITAKSAGVTIGTIRVSAQPAFSHSESTFVKVARSGPTLHELQDAIA